MKGHRIIFNGNNNACTHSWFRGFFQAVLRKRDNKRETGDCYSKHRCVASKPLQAYEFNKDKKHCDIITPDIYHDVVHELIGQT